MTVSTTVFFLYWRKKSCYKNYLHVCLITLDDDDTRERERKRSIHYKKKEKNEKKEASGTQK